MKKVKSGLQPAATPQSTTMSGLPLGQCAAAAALCLIDQLAPEAAISASGHPDDGDQIDIAALKQRCSAFGIDATTAELVLAGLYFLTQQTDTALEVAMLQSLRADRTFARRRSKRG